MSTYTVVATFVDEVKTFDTAEGAVRHALSLGNHYYYTVIDGIAATDHDVAKADAIEYAKTHTPAYVCSGCGGNHPYYYCGADDVEIEF